MATYTFYPRRADGVSLSLVAYDLDSDGDAERRAALILKDHASSAFVEAWQGERRVFALHRPPSGENPATARSPADGRGILAR